MNKIVKFLRFLMLFVAAIWGMVLGTIFPLTMLITPELTGELPNHVPALWLITSIVGFVVPCFLVRFGVYKIAAILCTAGGVSILIIHSLIQNAIDGFGLFYMPLLIESVVAIIIAVLVNVEKHRQNQFKKNNAPAASVLGGTYNAPQESEKSGGYHFAKKSNRDIDEE